MLNACHEYMAVEMLRPISEPILTACDRDDATTVAELLSPWVKAAQQECDSSEARDKLMAIIFHDIDEDTAVEAALRTSGAGGMDNIALRLYLAQCLTLCGPISRLENQATLSEMARSAHVERLAKSLRDQMIFFLPRLGMLLRPYTTGAADATAPAADSRDYMRLSSTEWSASSEHSRMRDWLEVHAELSHETFGLCVSFAFYQEYAEISKVLSEFGVTPQRQRQNRSRLPMNFPNDRPRGIGVALLTCLLLAKDALSLADEDDKSLRSNDAEKHRELSGRFQLAAATIVDALGDDVAILLLKHRNGQSALELATLDGMRIFLSQPALTGAIRRLWLGEFLFLFSNEPSLRGALEYVGLAACNLALLPLVAATPHQYAKPTALFGWVRLMGAPSRYLLEVAHFQALLYTICDLSFTLLLTIDADDLPCVGALWAASAVGFEVTQFIRAMQQQSVTERIGAVQGYFTQDLFNALDMPTFLLVLIVYLLTIYAMLYEASQAPHVTISLPASAGILPAAGSSVLDTAHTADGSTNVPNSGALSWLWLLETAIASALLPLASWTRPSVYASVESMRPALTCVAILFMWFRQLRVLTYVSRGMADLVQLIGRMVSTGGALEPPPGLIEADACRRVRVSLSLSFSLSLLSEC